MPKNIEAIPKQSTTACSSVSPQPSAFSGRVSRLAGALRGNCLGVVAAATGADEEDEADGGADDFDESEAADSKCAGCSPDSCGCDEGIHVDKY